MHDPWLLEDLYGCPQDKLNVANVAESKARRATGGICSLAR